MTSYLSIFTYILFIIAIHMLSTPKVAYKGNLLAFIGMLTIIITNLISLPKHILIISSSIILLGAIISITISQKIKLQNLPQIIALLNGFGGLSASLIGLTEINLNPTNQTLIIFLLTLSFITFSGSISAYLKLNNSNHFKSAKKIKLINLILFTLLVLSYFYPNKTLPSFIAFISITSILFGFFFISPIGGADMPIIISILNSLSGWATVLVGFSINAPILVITGTIIGASGIILTYIMTKSMNRSFLKIFFLPSSDSKEKSNSSNKHFNQGNALDAAFLMENAKKIIIVPGYGMASSNAEHELVTLAEILKDKYHIIVKFAIHPVAGRMPGHMNVLLAEANANPDDIFELKDINQEFKTTDVVYIIGANDITNPLAKTKEDSTIYQMPILEVEQAKHLLFVKRSLSPGYANLDNPLFYDAKTIMLLGDAKEITSQIITHLEQNIPNP